MNETVKQISSWVQEATGLDENQLKAAAILAAVGLIASAIRDIALKAVDHRYELSIESKYGNLNLKPSDS